METSQIISYPIACLKSRKKYQIFSQIAFLSTNIEISVFAYDKYNI